MALRTKDAISDRLLQKRGIRPATDTTNPDIRIAIRLGKSRASIGIDLSGEPLFRRGYAARKSSRSPCRRSGPTMQQHSSSRPAGMQMSATASLKRSWSIAEQEP